eukprot:1776975-Ditylum_brightwellii.AAC.1
MKATDKTAPPKRENGGDPYQGNTSSRKPPKLGGGSILSGTQQRLIGAQKTSLYDISKSSSKNTLHRIKQAKQLLWTQAEMMKM